MQLGDLAGQHDGTVAQHDRQILERLENPVRRFVEDQGGFLGLEILQRLPAAAGFRRKEAGKVKLVRRQPGGGQRGQ